MFSILFPYTENVVKYRVILSFFEKRYLNIRKIFDHTTPANISTSKSNYKWLIYAWLAEDKNPAKLTYLENLFDSNLNKNWWSENHIFFYNLFNLISVFRDVSNDNSLLNIKVLKNRMDFTIFYNLKNNPFLIYETNLDNPNYLPILINYLISFKKSNFDQTFLKNNPSTLPLNYFNSWELMGFNTESDNYSYILDSKINNFYLNGENFGNFNNLLTNFSETQSISHTLNNQLNIITQNRWLYRYSILHRKTFKILNKYTQIKSLITPKLDNTSNASQNLWFSKNLQNNIDNLVTIGGSDNFNFSNFKLSSKQSSDINFYESSFLWFLKRNYLLNSSNNLFYKTLINFEKAPIDDVEDANNLVTEDYSNKYKSAASFILSSQYFTNNNLQSPTLKLNSQSATHLNDIKSNIDSVNHYNLNDIYLYNGEDDILNLNSLQVLNWLSNTNTHQSANLFNFFKEMEGVEEVSMLLGFTEDDSETREDTIYDLETRICKERLINNSYNEDLNFLFIKSLLNFDDFFLLDIKLLLKI